MKRFGPAEDDHYAANVWPAVTDTILLMASIFIVLSVVTMANMARKFYDYKDPSKGSSQTLCVVWPLSGDRLFKTGDYVLMAGKDDIANILEKKLPPQIEKIRDYARSQKWGEYYIVLEASGHADNVPYMKDGVDQNWYLSAARANSVIHFIENRLKNNPALASKLSVAKGDGLPAPGSTILRAVGYSSYIPRTDFRGRSGPDLLRAQTQNRRVEIRLFAQPVGTIRLSVPDAPEH